MLKDFKLERLEAEELKLYRREQKAWAHYNSTRDLCDKAYSSMNTAWKKRSLANQELNRQYEILHRMNIKYDEVWGNFSNLRDEKTYEISVLRDEVFSLRQEMNKCFRQANEYCYYGQQEKASDSLYQGRKYKQLCDLMNEKIRKINDEIKVAKHNALLEAPIVDSSSFLSAKESFMKEKALHEAARTVFQSTKERLVRAKIEFRNAQKRHNICKVRLNNYRHTINQEDSFNE